MFVMVDCVREMTSKKSCKYSWYGLLEFLLILFEKYCIDLLESLVQC